MSNASDGLSIAFTSDDDLFVSSQLGDRIERFDADGIYVEDCVMKGDGSPDFPAQLLFTSPQNSGSSGGGCGLGGPDLLGFLLLLHPGIRGSRRPGRGAPGQGSV